MKKISLFLLLTLVVGCLWTFAKPPKKAARSNQPEVEKLSPEEESAMKEWNAKLDAEKQLVYQDGNVVLKDNLAQINLPENYRFLDTAQAKRVITEFWGNPPTQTNVLGMIVPKETSLLAPDSWAVVVTYTEDGHIEDSDAKSINYDDLLKEMQSDMQSENADRQKQGYAGIDLVGWAMPPHYDQSAHKLFWAKNLHFSDYPEENTLNYDVRVLGRKGVLSLNAVSSMDKVGEIEQNMNSLLPAIEFTSGNRYDDFDSGIDSVAAYGIGALIAGKLAAKAGLFTVIIGFLLAAKKFIILAVIAVGGFLSRLFFGKKGGGGNSTNSISGDD